MTSIQSLLDTMQKLRDKENGCPWDIEQTFESLSKYLIEEAYEATDAIAKKDYPNSELVIYPSRDKYESSRKQPFTSYFDRLRDFFLSGEGVFIISGYSFSDEHINELIFSCLKQNNRNIRSMPNLELR